MMRKLTIVVVVLSLLGGCSGASPTGPTATLSNCDGITLQPSCPQNQPTAVTSIQVPTDWVRVPENGGGNLPTRVQLTELNRVSSGFTWRVRTAVEQITGNPNDGCEYRFTLSDDGVNSRPLGYGWTLVGTEGSFPDGSPGSVAFGMGSFKYIVVETRCAQSGYGWRTGSAKWEVNMQ